MLGGEDGDVELLPEFIIASTLPGSAGGDKAKRKGRKSSGPAGPSRKVSEPSRQTSSGSAPTLAEQLAAAERRNKQLTKQLEEAQAADGATVPFIAILGWNKMIPKSNQLRAAFEAVSDGWGDLDPRLRFAVVERSRTADLGVKLWSAAQGTTVSCEKGRRTAPQMREWLERSIEMQTIGAAARV